MDNQNTKPYSFDLSIFKNEDTLECDGKQHYTDCESMKRLFVALKYYSMMNISENENDRELFDQFMHEVYLRFIDDYIHLNNAHSHELETIHNNISNNKTLFTECDISKCAFTTRHHKQQTGTEFLVPNLRFYKETMDSLHFYLFHCFDVGLRVKTEENNETKQEKKEKETEDKKLFDTAFSRINKMIAQRKHITQEFDRFSSHKNNKFNISVTSEEDTKGEDNTFLDSLYDKLKSESVSETDIEQLHSFIKKEEYETECIEYDITEDRNIAKVLKNGKCIQEMSYEVKH